MNRWRAPTQPATNGAGAEQPENMADFVAAHRAERMPAIRLQDARVAKQREALANNESDA